MTAAATQRGFLVLADISGYTSFVASGELEHAQDILSELLEVIVEKFQALLTIHKIEGDAVFAYISDRSLQRGETLFELVENTYLAFRARRDAAHLHTTCTCNACRNIPNLDLKFILHYGDYYIQDILGVKELVGSDVNLVHRLLKNQVSQATGWRAYALFSAVCLERLGLNPEGMHPQVESYEHLGEVGTSSMDLHARLAELMAARRVFITPDEAHATREYDFQAPVAVVWDWFQEPRLRSQWMNAEVQPVTHVRGRSGAGSRNHCVHGQNSVVVEDVLDVRGLDYFTVRHTPRGSPLSLRITFQFTSLADNCTHLRVAFVAETPPNMRLLARLICHSVLRFQILPRWKFGMIDALIHSADPG